MDIQFSQQHLLKTISFILGSWHLCGKSVQCKYTDLFLCSVFCSIGLFLFYASTKPFWLLLLHSIFWGVMPPCFAHLLYDCFDCWGSFASSCKFCDFMWIFFLFFLVLGFELRTTCLLKHSATWATPTALEKVSITW
jgi:hypothetical protein